MPTSSSILLQFCLSGCLLLVHYGVNHVVKAEPTSKPYLPFHTDPHDHPFVKHKINWNDERSNRARSSQVKHYNPAKEQADQQCPLQFTLGVSRRAHQKAQNSQAFSIVQPPVIHPVFPALGPGRQILHTTLYEHMDLLSPELAGPVSGSKSSTIIKEGLVQHQEYPLLFESSSFAYATPIIHDVNGDGIPDAILTDYDGGIYMMGLHEGPEGKRWFHRGQVPRIFVRRTWVEARVNETWKILYPEEAEKAKLLKQQQKEEAQAIVIEGAEENRDTEEMKDDEDDAERDPYHSYFEYASTYGQTDPVLRGVTANVLGQKREVVDALTNRRKRSQKNQEEGEEGGTVLEELNGEEETHRRLLEVFDEEEKTQPSVPRRRLLEVESTEDDDELEISFPRRRLQEVDAAEQERQQQQERERQEQAERERQQQEERERQEQAERERQQQQERERQEQEERERQQQQERERQEQAERERQEQQQQQQQDEPEKQEEKRGPEENAEAKEENEKNTEEQNDRSNRSSRSGRDAPEPGGDGDVGTWSGDDYARDEMTPPTDDRYNPYGDDMYGGGGGYDDYYGRYQSHRDDYYDEKHYVRINPHILCTPTLAEIPKLYGSNDEVEDVLFVPVSYYLDEDEYEGHMNYRRFEQTDPGDETEVQRGMYLASAIMIYQLGPDPRWGRQEHLDLSTDHSAPQNATLLGKIPVMQDTTKMGAFALSRPAVADIDGDGKLEVLIGTSMGIVYAFDATHMTMKENWPVQMQHAIESPVLVEDVAANTKLETFVADIGGNVACFDEDANKAWHRDLLANVADGTSTVRASSPMTLGDVNGDGILDIVIALQVFHEDTQKQSTYVFAMNAVGGEDLKNFPIVFDTPVPMQSKPGEDWVHQQLPGILLVDLHSDQSHIQDYIRRNGTIWEARPRSSSLPGGGSAAGLHAVFPLGEDLFIIEAGSGCTQTFGVGEEMVAMVQVDDVHGTNNLDLVVSTTAGNIITMESSAPYHPLNVWNNGEMRGRMNTYAQGFSASQGIFVHPISREYRDIFGVFVPVTFEIFDNRPNIENEPDKRVYKVEVRDGTSQRRIVWRNVFNATGIYTERVYIPHGAGYYSLTVHMHTSNGIVYEDTFHVGYNVNYMDGFGLMLWLPLFLATVTIFLGSSRHISRWDEDDYERDERNGAGLGILG